ncbi:MAG: hypothetical protein KGN78_15225, partial [Actinomycetales bacterium]|nr:hypothetical protein [Actinomycetales bacterium]
GDGGGCSSPGGIVAQAQVAINGNHLISCALRCAIGRRGVFVHFAWTMRQKWRMVFLIATARDQPDTRASGPEHGADNRASCV